MNHFIRPSAVDGSQPLRASELPGHRGRVNPPSTGCISDEMEMKGDPVGIGEMPVLNNALMNVGRTQRLGYVASVSPEGLSRVSPKGSLAVWGADHLVYADIESPNTVRNLAKNPLTEIKDADPFTRNGNRFTGAVSPLHGVDLYFKILESCDVARTGVAEKHS